MQLIRRSKDRYVIVIERDAFMQEYDLNGAIDMLLYMGIASSEIEFMMSELIRNDHSIAEIGSFGTLLYTRPAQIQEPVLAA